MSAEKLHIGGVEQDAERCLRCGSQFLDTGWECTDCGYDNIEHYCPPELLARHVEVLRRERAVLLDKLNGTPCAEVRWQQELDAAEARADNLRAEVERANSWNERVSVCRDHVADIVDGPCVICALDAAEARAERLAEVVRGWWKARRPVGWTEDQHRSCPHVNLATDAEKALATALLRDQEEGK